MKKLMVMLLGLAFAVGTIGPAFAQTPDTTKQDTTKKEKKKKAAKKTKKTDKKAEAPPQ